MNKLDMIKAFAKLEGAKVIEVNGDMYTSYSSLPYSEDLTVEYNPITDLALTMKAVIDYCVNSQHDICEEQQEHFVTFNVSQQHYVTAYSVSDAPHAIIECILKSKGLWVGE